VVRFALRFLLSLVALASFSLLAIKTPQIHRNFLYREVGNKVVEVVKVDPLFGQIQGGGTGWSVKLHGKYYIITNKHVCEMYQGDKNATIKLNDGRLLHRQVISISDISDLCAIEGIEEIGALSLADNIYIGEIVSVVGHPLLLPINVSYGAILEENNFQIGFESELAFLSTCQILPGNSGSPVVNYRGQVVGVAFAADSDVHWGLIIPLDDLKMFLSRLS